MQYKLMEGRIKQIEQAWNDRHNLMGLTKRAVLFKRFPTWLNEVIHRRHMDFIMQNIPPQPRHLLDVGCGYGRLSREIKESYPDIDFQGVDLCTEFAAAYRQEIGPCFNGPIQDFKTNKRFNTIIIVTCLMYLDPKEHQPTLERLWSMLTPGGRLICIEPAIEILQLWRKLSRQEFASPTGDTVHHFRQDELRTRCCDLSGALLINMASVPLIPFVDATSLHHAVAVIKHPDDRDTPGTATVGTN